MYQSLATMWMVAILYGTAVFARELIEMRVGQSMIITNNRYPQPSQYNTESWEFRGSPGGALKVECDDIRINAKTCGEGRFMISIGDYPQRICDAMKTYNVISSSDFLFISLNLNSGTGAFRCKVTALNQQVNIDSRQAEVYVKTGTLNTDIMVSNLQTMKQQEYVIKTDPGSNLFASCELEHSYNQGKNPCELLKLRFRTKNNKIKTFCETSKNIVFYANADSMTINFDTGLSIGDGFLFCNVRGTVGGADYVYYKGIQSEEIDSIEHGRESKQGVKKTTCSCGWANKSNRRVIYGYDAAPYEFPWAVSLQTLQGFHFCGGSIISEYHILTAAHCVAQSTPDQIQIVMGTNYNEDRRNSIRVKQIIRHDYDPDTAHEDMAILVLQRKIQYSEYVGPVCLPNKHENIDRQYVTAMGWGKLADDEYKHKNPNLLKKTKVRVVDIYSCTQDWDNLWDYKNARVICTWSNHTDICMGDSGGPVVWLDPETNRYTLVGMPALCDGCVLIRPSIHTAVALFYDWIQTKIAGSFQPTGKTCTKIN